MQTKLETWETAVRERPWAAQLFGPPAWLVQEEWRGMNVESIFTAANRVRACYGLGEPQAPMSLQDVPTTVVPTENVPTPCEDCGLRSREGRYRLCAGCRKRQQRSPED